MRALDTNVLARFFIDDADDPQAVAQRPAAIAALSARAFVSVTVLLEFEWVMRGFYDMTRAEISQVLRGLMSFEQVSIEDRNAVLSALDAFDLGMDFADAVHLARVGRASAFLTFDRRLAHRAGVIPLAPRVELLS